MGGAERRTAVAGEADGLPVAVAGEALLGRVLVGVGDVGAAGVLDGDGVRVTDAALHADAEGGEEGFAAGLAVVGDAGEDVADPLGAPAGSW